VDPVDPVDRVDAGRGGNGHKLAETLVPLYSQKAVDCSQRKIEVLQMKQRGFVLIVLGLAVSAIACGGPGGRVVILGFDGVEPSIVEGMLSKGELPNLAKLREQGGYGRLGSSNPPQSPTAWSSFATCTRPGNHGVYDFLRRNPKTYVPGLGFGAMKQPELAPDGMLARAPEFLNYRKGETFWSVANKDGARCKLLIVPFAYPAEPLTDSCMLCGLDVPDIRGTQSTFIALSDQFKEQESVAGGVRIPLRFENNAATVQIPGLRYPKDKDKENRFVEVPMTVTVDRTARKVTLDIQGQKRELAEGNWSEWFEWTFQMTPRYAVKAISRFHLLEAGEQVRLYMSCLQIHPKEPMMPISTPATYSGEIADRYGLYKTVGWVYDTKALQQDELTDDVFLDDVRKTMAWHERLMLDELDRNQFDLLVAAWTGTDRVAHMFWRFRDPKHPLYTEEGAKKYGQAVEETYRKMDEIVGKAMEKLSADDLLMVLSDHGFHSFRTGFSVNTWLVRNGYLSLKGQTDPATAFTEEKFLQGIDWGRTRAYGLGLGSVFLNLKGRERDGVVDPAEAPGLLKEMKEKLLAVTDPATGDKVFEAVYLQADVYTGLSQSEAPDMQVGYAEGYQTDKSSASGAAPKDLFVPNDDKWSGEHAASDVEHCPGILFSSKPFTVNATLLDIGPTALKYLGKPIPAAFEGKPLF